MVYGINFPPPSLPLFSVGSQVTVAAHPASVWQWRAPWRALTSSTPLTSMTRILETIALSSASHRDRRSLMQTERGSGECEKDGGTFCGLTLTQSTFHFCVLLFDHRLETSALGKKNQMQFLIISSKIPNWRRTLTAASWCLVTVWVIKVMFVSYFNCTENLHHLVSRQHSV